MDALSDSAVLDGGFKLGAGDALFKAHVELRAGIAVCDIPHFRFGFTAECGGEMGGWMDLQGEVFPAVQNLYENGETRMAVASRAKDFRPMVHP